MNARGKVVELVENGLLSWETVARECLEYMSTDDIQDMADTNAWLDAGEA